MVRLYAAPCFGQAQRGVGGKVPLPKIKGDDVEPRHAAPLAQLVSRWRNSTSAAAAALTSPDGRWAVVSTSVTALIAGSIAWLGAGIMPMNGTQPSTHQRALMPYELFLRLAKSSAADASYA